MKITVDKTPYNINCIWTLEFPRRVPTACSHGAKDLHWFPRHPNVPMLIISSGFVTVDK